MQCAIPVFAGLLPEPQNGQVLKLLFVLAHWHGLAKLRLHTDETLRILEDVTGEVGNEIRRFVDETCAAFSTRELQREAECRIRLQARKKSGTVPHSDVQGAPSNANGRRPKVLNLRTYKLHALGDYAAQIRLYGTTDSYSTQTVCYLSIFIQPSGDLTWTCIFIRVNLSIA